jgi:hypothetical protein
MAGQPRSRDRCGARCRDGTACEAPVYTPENFRCKRHGGASPQAVIAARRRELALAVVRAEREWLAARGTNRERGKFYLACDAYNELERYDAKLAQLRELRALLRERRAAERRAAA